MKKRYFLLTLLFFVSMVAQAQQPTIKMVVEPTKLADFCGYIPFTGASPQGRYLYGTFYHDVFLYDTEKGDFLIKSGDSPEGKDIIKILDDGTQLITTGQADPVSGHILFSDGSQYDIQPYDNEFCSVWLEDMTSDKNLVLGNFLNAALRTKPFVAKRQEDGSYKAELLPQMSVGVFGTAPYYDQALYIINNGEYIYGREHGNLGFDGRILLWVRQSDGSYICTTDSDKYFFNLDAPEPGDSPEWDDYVTVSENDPKYPEQEAAFDKAYSEWEKRVYDRINLQSSLDPMWISKDFSTNMMLLTLQSIDKESHSVENVFPAEYDPIKDSFISYPDVNNMHPCARLKDGSLLLISEVFPDWETFVRKSDGKIVPFHEWLKEISGYDITPIFGEKLIGSAPIISEDGRVFAVSYLNSETSQMEPYYFVFSESIAAVSSPVVERGIEPAQISISNGEIRAKAGASIRVYSVDGQKIYEGVMPGSGIFRLEMLQQNETYIVQVDDGRKIAVGKCRL